MKLFIGILIGFMLFGCDSSNDTILGTWRANERHYSATYSIIKENDAYNGVVLSYSDGTKSIKHNPYSPYYLFKNLKWEGEKYIDGISGATKSENQKSQFIISIQHKDTISVTSSLSGGERKENWVRVKH